MFTLSWDYLTVTSWMGIDQRLLDAVKDDDIVRQKRLQYAGEGVKGQGGWFHGQAIQSSSDGGDFQHWMFVASGDSAEHCRTAAKNAMIEPMGDIKRLDCQVSVVRPAGFNLASFGLALKSGAMGSFRRRGRYPHVSLILSDTATIYIGRRGKGRMFRLYEKFVNGTMYIRFEIEYSGDLAKDAFQRREDKGLASLILAEFDTLPSAAALALEFISDYLHSLESGARVPRGIKVNEAGDTFGWLIGAIHVGAKRLDDFTPEQKRLLAEDLRRLLAAI